jgi:DNA-binding transcriptional regulator YhcF (GntR family)
MYRINTKIDIPIYTQLVDMIKADIRSGAIPYGSKLPTVRELSDSCGVAAGTVMKAYEELERQGLAEKQQGKGTFVCYRESSGISRKEKAMAAIDKMLDTLEELNFSESEMNIFLNLKLRERSFDSAGVQIAVIECNDEILRQISSQVRALGGVSVYSYRLDEIQKYPYQITDDIDLVILSSIHIDELPPSTDRSRIAKVALSLVPRSVFQIVRIPRGSRVGMVCQSSRFAELLNGILADYTEDIKLSEPLFFSDDPAEYMKDLDVLLVPSGFEHFCDQNTARLISDFGRKHTLIQCEYHIDEGSLMYVEDRIGKIRTRK